jgi:hypothetical protein
MARTKADVMSIAPTVNPVMVPAARIRERVWKRFA